MSVLASLNDIELEAQARLSGPVYDYFAGGADDERTLALRPSVGQVDATVLA